MERGEGESKGEVCSVETAMWDFSGQILEAGVWTKPQIFQPGMCTVPGRLPTTERERKKERKRKRQREKDRGKDTQCKRREVKKNEAGGANSSIRKRNVCSCRECGSGD